MDTQETKDNVQELVTRAERINDIVIQTLASLKSETIDISKSLPRLTFEIEELKKTRDTLVSSLSEKMKEVYLKQSKDFSDRLSTAFLEKAEKGLQTQKKQYEASLKTIRDDFHDQIHREKQEIQQDLDTYNNQAKEISRKYLDDAEKFKQEMENNVSSMTNLMNLQKQRLTHKGLLICGVFCLTSVLTGMGLFYFFPQNIYYSDLNVARYMMMGRATWENMKHLSTKDQNIPLDGMNKYMAKK